MLIPGIHDGVLKTIFIDTWLDLSIFGQPPNGFRFTLIDIIILLLLATVVNYIAERLTGKKVGTLFAGTVITFLGAWIMLAFVRLPAPLDFRIEDIAVIAALLGSIIIAVFYTLIRAQMGSKKG